jgi:hypothetical protein
LSEGTKVGLGDPVGDELGAFESVGGMDGVLEGLGLGTGESVGAKVTLLSFCIRSFCLKFEPSLRCDAIRHAIEKTEEKYLMVADLY